MDTPAIKTCKCGSTKHKRTNHKDCPMNKKLNGCPDKKDTVSTTQNGYGWMGPTNSAFTAWTAGEMYDQEWTHDGDDYFGPGPAAMRE